MQKTFPIVSVLAVAFLFLVPAARAAETNATPEAAEAKYTAAIEGRTADILKVLALADTNKAAKVRDTIMAQYRALRAWHDDYDGKLLSKPDTNAVALIRMPRKSLHDQFLRSLAEQLTSEQIEMVKDKMTYGKVQFTFNGYLSQYPDLSAENRAEILRLLKEAREEAMDGGSAEEKTAVFQRYKGKINNYLSKQGVHPAKQKASPATNSAALQ
jgi:hypothetical protein